MYTKEKTDVILGYGFSVNNLSKESLINLVKEMEPCLFKTEEDFYKEKNKEDSAEDIAWSATMDIILFSSMISKKKGDKAQYICDIANFFAPIKGKTITFHRNEDIIFARNLMFDSDLNEDEKKTRCQAYLTEVCDILTPCADDIKKCFGAVHGYVWAKVEK